MVNSSWLIVKPKNPGTAGTREHSNTQTFKQSNFFSWLIAKPGNP